MFKIYLILSLVLFLFPSDVSARCGFFSRIGERFQERRQERQEQRQQKQSTQTAPGCSTCGNGTATVVPTQSTPIFFGIFSGCCSNGKCGR